MISVVLFDLGGTLMHFDADLPGVLARADRALYGHLKDAGLDLDGRSFTRDLRARLEWYYARREVENIEYPTLFVLREVLYERGFTHVSETRMRSALEAMYAVTQAHWRVETDALPTLTSLKAQGYRLGLISNAGDDPDVQILVDKAGVRPFFDVILTSAAQGIRKPDPRIFHQALSHWTGVDPHNAVMVGDTLGADILGAQNAGLLSVWITRRADPADIRAHAAGVHPDASISSLAELPVSLGRLMKIRQRRE